MPDIAAKTAVLPKQEDPALAPKAGEDRPVPPTTANDEVEVSEEMVVVRQATRRSFPPSGRKRGH